MTAKNRGAEMIAAANAEWRFGFCSAKRACTSLGSRVVARPENRLLTFFCRPLLLAIFPIALCHGHESAAATNNIDATMLAYNLKTTTGAYASAGSKSAKWDADATNCLATYAGIRASTNGASAEEMDKLAAGLTKLEAAKCDDPLIAYLHTRFVFSKTHSLSEDAQQYEHAASGLQKSDYPAIRKFYAFMWAARSYAALPAQQAKTASLLRTAADWLRAALDDKSMPAAEADQACDQIMTVNWWSDSSRWTLYSVFEPALTNRWNGTSLALLTKGRAYLTYAWIARGTGYAQTVTDQGWTLMRSRLDTAAASLEAAWTLNSNDVRICIEMIRVELGQGKGRERMELWFKRGMKLDSAGYDLCYAKLEYLRPRWYGDVNEMIRFGRECTLNTNFSGTVRLMLADAHYEASREIQDDDKRAAYWRQTNVWPDIRMAFEQFFKLYPEAVGYRHNYARYAVWCGQWQDFQDQIKLFPSTNYDFFGGVEQFNKMVSYAAEQTKKK